MKPFLKIPIIAGLTACVAILYPESAEWWHLWIGISLVILGENPLSDIVFS